MIWELLTLATILIFVFYLFITWNKKRELKKLRRYYNAEEDQSRREGQGRFVPVQSTNGRTGIETPRSRESEQSFERTPEPERRKLLQVPDDKFNATVINGVTGTSPGNKSPKNRLAKLLRRRR